MAPSIVTEGLTKRFGSLTALDGLDLEIAEGEVFGFLGPNGAGKTTTVRLLLGMLRPTGGRATVMGLDVWRDPVEVHRHVSYVSGEVQVWPSLRGGEMLDLLGNIHGGFDSAYRTELCERFDFDPSKKGRSYSKGNRQKVALIAALMVRPHVLVLDEPTAGLDPLMEATFRHCVAEARERGQTIFLSSHILSEVEAVCDRVGILRAGRLVEVGTLAELRHLSAYMVTIRAEQPLPDLSSVPGVSDVHVEDRTTTLQLQGPAAPLLDALAGHDVVDIHSREPSLEELFLAHYGGRGEPEPTPAP